MFTSTKEPDFMKPAQTLFSLRHICVYAAAGAALLSASSAFAQSAPSPYYSFQVENDTLSSGDPVFSITDNLTFTNLQINEVFADNFTQTVLVPSLNTATVLEQTGAVFFDGSTPGALSDPIHGTLTSAILTGSLGSGPTQTVNVATAFGGPVTPQVISSTFSASLFGPSATALGLGQFSLLDSTSNTIPGFPSIVIGANPVPEASTVVSMGLMLALGLGALMVTRRRTAAK